MRSRTRWLLVALAALVACGVGAALLALSSPSGSPAAGGNRSESPAPPNPGRGPSSPGSRSGPSSTGSSPPGAVSACGTALCVAGVPWPMYGATIYNPGVVPYRSGLKDPADTITLAREAHLNTIRITDFLDVNGSPDTAPYDPARWRLVDGVIAAARSAGMHVDLGLADYRAVLWNNCVDPYTADWSKFLGFVADRVNTVDGSVYRDDPTLALVSIAGEPKPANKPYAFTASATGKPCTLTYSTADLTAFYRQAIGAWQARHPAVLIDTGGLGYLNETHSGIDWRTIFALPGNATCAIKTYGGMQAWAPTAAAYCASLGKPLIDEEFGWQQQVGDDQRAADFAAMYAMLHSLHVAGIAFWNLGYQTGPTSYEVGPATPKTFAAIQIGAPG
jgi:hypothetical protein